MKRPIAKLTTQRLAEIFDEMISVRRLYCADNSCFLMSDFWEEVCDGSEEWSIKQIRAQEREDHRRKGGVIEFDGRLSLVVDEKIMEKARKGELLANFILAHEAAHVGLDHYRRSAVVKNFQLNSSSRGMSNIPPTVEELEANLAAVFLQCGVALLDRSRDALALARQAHTDPHYVKLAQRYTGLEVFIRELDRLTKAKRRVVL